MLGDEYQKEERFKCYGIKSIKAAKKKKILYLKIINSNLDNLLNIMA